MSRTTLDADEARKIARKYARYLADEDVREPVAGRGLSVLDAEQARIERDTRARIVMAVRQHCTPSGADYAAGGDTLIAAVADWIENLPEWVSL